MYPVFLCLQLELKNERCAHNRVFTFQVLGDIIDSTDTLGEAVEIFSKQRAIEGKKLVTISRELDRPGECFMAARSTICLLTVAAIPLVL